MAKKTARRKQDIPKDESKADRFVRVVTPRIVKACKSIRIIGFCSGSAYEYTTEQVQQITEALFSAVNGVVDALSVKKKDAGGFAFKE